jgi:ArsR family transcriptional regulator
MLNIVFKPRFVHSIGALCPLFLKVFKKMHNIKKLVYNIFIMSIEVYKEETLVDIAEFLKALGHPIRLKIVELLIEHKQCVKNLGDVLGIPQPNISQHLAILRSKGIVGWKREGAIICYFIKDKRAIEVYNLLIKEVQDGTKYC